MQLNMVSEPEVISSNPSYRKGVPSAVGFPHCAGSREGLLRPIYDCLPIYMLQYPRGPSSRLIQVSHMVTEQVRVRVRVYV
jgi:hypothetical protein